MACSKQGISKQRVKKTHNSLGEEEPFWAWAKTLYLRGVILNMFYEGSVCKGLKKKQVPLVLIHS